MEITQAVRGLSETSTHLSKPSSHRETMRLDVMLARTAASYPNQELSPETFGEFRESLKELASIHGISAVEKALRTLRLTSKFFPHPAEINETIAAANEAARVALQAKRNQERLEQYAREEEHRREHPEEYCSMADILEEHYTKRGQQKTSTLPADEQFTDNTDRVMNAFSKAMYAGAEYEPSIVQQVNEWRLKQEAKRGQA